MHVALRSSTIRLSIYGLPANKFVASLSSGLRPSELPCPIRKPASSDFRLHQGPKEKP
jgi:hypothetical protein